MGDQLPAERKTSTSEVAIEPTGGGGMLMPSSLAEVIRFGEVMAKAAIAVPKHLRDNPGACTAVCMQAMRWEMDPFAVANKTYSVNDRLAYEAQLVAAVVHTRAPIAMRPEYEFEGEPGTTRRCKVSCVMKDGTIKEYVSPAVQRITVKNSPLWKSDEDQQLGYFAIRAWARRYAPEVILGVYTPEEAAEMRDVTPQRTGLAERLPGSSQGGFSRARVESEITGEVQDAEITPVEATESPLQTIDEVLAGDDLPEALKGSSEPEPPMDWNVWVEGMRAEIMRFKTADAALGAWKANFEKISELKEADGELFGRLETWMEARTKRLRQKEADAVNGR